MGNLHHGTGGGSSYPEIAEARRSLLSKELEAVEAWLAAGGSRSAIDYWVTVPSGASTIEQGEEERINWWRSGPPWLAKKRASGIDALQECCVKHHCYIYGSDVWADSTGVEWCGEPGDNKFRATWARPGPNPGQVVYTTRTVRGESNACLLACAEELSQLLTGRVFDE